MTVPILSVSSWSLHPLLGRAWYERDASGRLTNRSDATAEIELVDVPGEAARHGIGTVELCHFHFPTVEDGYLQQLRAAISEAGIELFSVLIDTGDISAADDDVCCVDLEMMRRWIDVASILGARHVRIIAGDSAPSKDAISRCVAGLVSLAQYAKTRDVRVLTENFKQLAARPQVCLEILERCEGRVGLCADFGNFPTETRSQDLAAILPRANSVHAKADYPGGEMDRAAYVANVQLAVNAGFDGPMSLIYQDDDDVWRRLDEMKQVTESVWLG